MLWRVEQCFMNGTQRSKNITNVCEYEERKPTCIITTERKRFSVPGRSAQDDCSFSPITSSRVLVGVSQKTRKSILGGSKFSSLSCCERVQTSKINAQDTQNAKNFLFRRVLCSPMSCLFSFMCVVVLHWTSYHSYKHA